jgi:hypothetical protein
MKKALIITLLSITSTPIPSFANSESLVTVFESYCLKQVENLPVLDHTISDKTDVFQIKYNAIRGQGDNGYVMTLAGRPYLIEWIGDACRVSTNGAFPNDVMRALASNHMLTLPHGDEIDFRRAHWFEPGHTLTQYAFTHDLSKSTILLEYQRDDATTHGPVAITITK